MSADLSSMLGASQETVVKVGGHNFFKYQQGLLPASALPVYGQPGSVLEMRSAMKTSKSLLLRWQDQSVAPTEWWTMVCRDTSLSHLKKKTRWTTRKNIKSGRAKFVTERASAQSVAKDACQSHVHAYSRYQNSTPMARAEFENSILRHAENGSVEFWICKELDTQNVVGWCMFWLDASGAFLHTIDISPSALRSNAGYAFISACLDEYVDGRQLAVSNGTRSVSHATGMQDFLRKLGFQREYGRLHVEYAAPLSLLVKMLMPLRLLVPRIRPLHLLRALLDQEKFARDCQPPSLVSKIAKRFFDCACATVGIIAVSWIVMPCWLIATISTGANGIFAQQRVGRDGNFFRLFKLRSMRDIHGMTTTVTAANDQRITKFGSFLRTTKLDELPQLLNVLMGQMSFVGPRPDVVGWADELSGEDKVILEMRPGITGPASIFFRNEEQLLEDASDAEAYNRDTIWPQKVAINRQYYYQQSFVKDLAYLLRTVLPSRDR